MGAQAARLLCFASSAGGPIALPVKKREAAVASHFPRRLFHALGDDQKLNLTAN
jgi:hypothetical protein